MTDETAINEISTRMLKHFKYPNTYTFSKWMAEHLVISNRGNMPVAIVRPSIVGAAAKDPTPGWIDAVSAAASTNLFLGLGILNVILGDGSAVSDQVCAYSHIELYAHVFVLLTQNMERRRSDPC